MENENNITKNNVSEDMNRKDRSLVWALIGLFIGFTLIPDSFAQKPTAAIFLGILSSLIAYNWTKIEREFKKAIR